MRASAQPQPALFKSYIPSLLARDTVSLPKFNNLLIQSMKEPGIMSANLVEFSAGDASEGLHSKVDHTSNRGISDRSSFDRWDDSGMIERAVSRNRRDPAKITPSGSSAGDETNAASIFFRHRFLFIWSISIRSTTEELGKMVRKPDGFSAPHASNDSVRTVNVFEVLLTIEMFMNRPVKLKVLRPSHR
jgi:hypothetical protein